MKKVEVEDEWGELERELMDGKEGKEKWGGKETETEREEEIGFGSSDREEAEGGHVGGFGDGASVLSVAAWSGRGDASECRR